LSAGAASFKRLLGCEQATIIVSCDLRADHRRSASRKQRTEGRATRLLLPLRLPSQALPVWTPPTYER